MVLAGDKTGKKQVVETSKGKNWRKQLFAGVVVGVTLGLFAFVGTFAGNFLWWFQQQNPKHIYLIGFGYIVAFILGSYLMMGWAIRELKK